MVRQLSPAGELAKLAGSRESRTQQAVAEGREQERKELLAGTLNRKVAERRAREDEAAGVDSDFTIIEGLRTGKIITIDDLVGRMNRGQSSPELQRNISDTYGIERGPRQYMVELREGLNIGTGQPPRPQGYPPSSQQQYSQRNLPQSYSEDSADFFGEYESPKQSGQVTTRSPKQAKSGGAKQFFLDTKKAKTASEAAEFEFFNKGQRLIGGNEELINPEGYDFSDLRFGTSSGRAEDIAKLKSGKEAFEYLGIPYSEQPNKDKPERSKSQTKPYFAGMYANPNFDVDANKEGIQAYDGISDYNAPVRGKEDRSAQYSSVDFVKQGDILQEPLSPEKKAYYSKPRETRGQNPFKTESQFQAFFSESFKPARDQKTKEAEQRIAEFSQPQSGGPNIKVRESQQFTGSPKIQELKARAKGQQGTSEDIPFVEARGLPSSYTYLGTTFGTPTEAMRAKEEANRLKRLQAEERRLADESRTDIGKGGKINVSGLLPKEKIDTSPQLSEQFDAVIPDPNVVFSGLGSTQRSSPIPRRGKQYTVEKPSEEIGYGNLGSFGFGTIEPTPVKQAKPKDAEKQSGIPVSDVYGKPTSINFEAPKGDNAGYESQGYGNLLGYNLSPKTEEPKPTGNSFADFMNRAGYVNTEIAKGVDDLMYKISVDTLNTGSSIQAFLDPNNKEIYESQKYKRERSPTDDYWDYAFGTINDTELGKRREKYYSEKGPIRAAVTEGGEVAYYVGDIALGGKKAITDIGEKVGPKIIPVLKKLNPESPLYQPLKLDDIISGASKIIKKQEGDKIVLTTKQGLKIKQSEEAPWWEKLKNVGKEVVYMKDDKTGKIKYEFIEKQSPESLYRDLGRQARSKTPKAEQEQIQIEEFGKEVTARSKAFREEQIAKAKAKKELEEYMKTKRDYSGLQKGIDKERQNRLDQKPNDIFGDFDEKANPQGSLNWERLFTRKPEGKGAKQVSIGEQQGNIPKGTPESVGKITLGGSKFINKKTGAVITGVTGTGIFLGNEFFNNQNKPKGKNKDRDELALFPYLDQPQGQTPFLDQPQKEKEKQTPSQKALALLEFGQGQESSQRQSQRQRYRLNVPQMPEEIPFFQQPQLPAEKFAYDEPPINIAPTGFEPWLLRGGGGGGFGGDESDQGFKFFRVFDVAKSPFGRVQKSVGYYEDSLAPNFEIKAYSKNPLGLARPKDISEEEIGNLFGETKKRKSRKK